MALGAGWVTILPAWGLGRAVGGVVASWRYGKPASPARGEGKLLESSEELAIGGIGPHLLRTTSSMRLLEERTKPGRPDH